jgi:hypothetical protein
MEGILKPYQIEHLKKSYPPGTRIELISDMVGESIPKGTRGTVAVVDDTGTLHTDFDNGRSLGVLPDVDSFRRIDDRADHMHQESRSANPTDRNAQKAKKRSRDCAR